MHTYTYGWVLAGQLRWKPATPDIIIIIIITTTDREHFTAVKLTQNQCSNSTNRCWEVNRPLAYG